MSGSALRCSARGRRFGRRSDRRFPYRRNAAMRAAAASDPSVAERDGRGDDEPPETREPAGARSRPAFRRPGYRRYGVSSIGLHPRLRDGSRRPGGTTPGARTLPRTVRPPTAADRPRFRARRSFRFRAGSVAQRRHSDRQPAIAPCSSADRTHGPILGNCSHTSSGSPNARTRSSAPPTLEASGRARAHA